jgi:hypothetical protein
MKHKHLLGILEDWKNGLITGMLEYWNIGILGKKVRIRLVCVIIPPFHHSIVPAFFIIPLFHDSIIPYILTSIPF